MPLNSAHSWSERRTTLAGRPRDLCRLHLPLPLRWCSLLGTLGCVNKHLLAPRTLGALLLGRLSQRQRLVPSSTASALVPDRAMRADQSHQGR